MAKIPINQAIIKEEVEKLVKKGNVILNESQNRQRITAYLYIIFSLASLSIFGLFAIGPTITTIFDLNKQLEESKQALSQLEIKNKALSSLENQYSDIEPDLQLIDEAIPSSSNIAKLTRQIEELSINNRLSLQKIDTGLLELFPAKNPNTNIYSFTFSLGATGTKENIDSFVSDLINMERIISVDRLSTGKKTDDIYSISISGKAFFYKKI